MILSLRKTLNNKLFCMEFRHQPEKTPLRILTSPFILFMIVPFVFLDICLEVYHRICFPVYGISLVDRRKYIRIDRHKLSYLKGVEKVFCVYCGYANGLLQYATTVAAETERYWCGIKHSPAVGLIDPPHHKDFLPYADKGAFENFVSQKVPTREKDAHSAVEET